MRRMISRLVFTAGFALIALLALIGSSSGVSANLPYPECGPAIPCGGGYGYGYGYGYAPYTYSQPVYNAPVIAAYNAPLYTNAYRAPYYAYNAPVYAPTYYNNGNVFANNGCSVGNYTCLRNKGIGVPPPYAFNYYYR